MRRVINTELHDDWAGYQGGSPLSLLPHEQVEQGGYQIHRELDGDHLSGEGLVAFRPKLGKK